MQQQLLLVSKILCSHKIRPKEKMMDVAEQKLFLLLTEQVQIKFTNTLIKDLN
jgi:hypothetical protein